jgi:hypothetical protein
LRIVVAILALIPIGAGVAGMIAGTHMISANAPGLDLNSHYRYLSGVLAAIGLVFLFSVSRIEFHTSRVRLLTFVVFVGGLARLFSIMADGWPGPPMLGGLMIELVAVPLLCLWQGRVARQVDLQQSSIRRATDRTQEPKGSS